MLVAFGQPGMGQAPSSVGSTDSIDMGCLSAEKFGAGQAVVFLPGLTSSVDVFRDTVGELDAEIHFVTLAGFDGTKAPDPASPFIQPAAESVVDYLEANDVQNVSLVGHSLGGVVAMLAASGTDRVERVLIVDSVPFLSALLFSGNTPEMARAYRPTLESQLELMDKEAWLQQRAKSGLAVQAISEGGRNTVFEDIRAADLKVSKAAYLDIMTTDYSEDFAKVSVPVTVLIPFDPGAC